MTSLTRDSRAPGQNHDRISHDAPLPLPNVLPETGGGAGDLVETTAFQKMLSATSGSLLTTLLGMCEGDSGVLLLAVMANPVPQ